MRNVAKSKLLRNGHIRVVSGRTTMTIDVDTRDNTYYVYGDCYGSSNNNTIDKAIDKVFTHLPIITNII